MSPGQPGTPDQPHHLDWRLEHLFFGYFDATTPAVLEIASGDEIILDCLPAGSLASLPPGHEGVLPAHLAALRAPGVARGPSTHVMTGPVHVRGAEPGDVLQVDILDIQPRQTWGFTAILPLKGALPEEFTNYQFMHIAVDPERGTCRLPWGLELPLDPFFGIMAVAPPPAWGRLSSAEPRAFGGNMDNRELRPGTTLYLPVFNDGALFSAGDGHGRQGDGEVSIAALETALTGRFRLTVRKDMKITGPFAEDALQIISMGFDADLDEATRKAIRAMIDLVVERAGITRDQAYMMLSLASDLIVTQVVDGEKGVHMKVRKEWLKRA